MHDIAGSNPNFFFNNSFVLFVYLLFFMPPDRMIGGILFLSCLFVCLSVCLLVCLLSTLTFAMTFEPLEVDTSYLANILH